MVPLAGKGGESTVPCKGEGTAFLNGKHGMIFRSYAAIFIVHNMDGAGKGVITYKRLS